MLHALSKRMFATKDHLDEEDYQRAERGLIIDGVCSTGMSVLQGGPFLAAFALALGASNYEVGLLASIGFLSQFAQLAGLFLVQKFPHRRVIVLLAAGISRFLWILILCIPIFFLDRGVTFLMQWLLIVALVGAVAGPSWNSLLRDIVPENKMGNLFSRRMLLGTVLALLLTLMGGYFVDLWETQFPDHALYAFSILFLIGGGFGVLGLIAISRLPEPTAEVEKDIGLMKALSEPMRDVNFRGLLKYIAFWNFAINLAGPFFIVYLLERLQLSMKVVTLLVVTSQLSNIVFLRIWGKLADKYSNKSVLTVSGPVFLLAILLWTFTTLPEMHVLTLPLLIIIHVLSGMAIAGISLATGNIALKLSPSGKAHVYMTVFGLAGAVTGALAPMVGGIFADFFASREMSITLNWGPKGEGISLYALNLKALDFLFLMAFGLGLFSLRFLRSVVEEGEVEEKVIRQELLMETFATVRTVAMLPGLRNMVGAPISSVSRLLGKITVPKNDKTDEEDEDQESN